MRAGVVVQHPEPLGVGTEFVEVREPGAQGGGETGRGRHRDHGVTAEGVREQVGTRVLAAGVDRHTVRDRGQLAGQPVEDRGEPALAVVAHQHHRDVLAAARGHRRVTRICGGHDRSG